MELLIELLNIGREENTQEGNTQKTGNWGLVLTYLGIFIFFFLAFGFKIILSTFNRIQAYGDAGDAAATPTCKVTFAN